MGPSGRTLLPPRREHPTTTPLSHAHHPEAGPNASNVIPLTTTNPQGLRITPHSYRPRTKHLVDDSAPQSDSEAIPLGGFTVPLVS
ncbi:unnamed protein product [Arctogadus glacialis]